jgi:hypothetical protein
VPVRVDANWKYHGLTCVRIENELLAVDILPQRGANIFRVIDKATDTDVLWKSPRVAPHLAALHSDFDDHWAGGWDDAFPGGRASRNRYGDLIPYMGEVWTQHATWHVDATGSDEVTVTTSVVTPITPARFVKTLSIRTGQPTISLSYEITNIGYLPFDYNWGIHPSLAVRPSWRFDIPATHGIVDEAGGELLGVTGQRYDWPHLNGLDLRDAMGPEKGAFALHYLTGLTAGWVAATDRASRRGFGLCFDRKLFPVVWFCLVYGGWRGYYQALIEPWTGYPSPLDEAVAARQARSLEPGERVSAEVTGVLYGGVESVSDLKPDGTVTA